MTIKSYDKLPDRLSITDTAALLGLSRMGLYKVIRRGDLEIIPSNGKKYPKVDKAALLAPTLPREARLTIALRQILDQTSAAGCHEIARAALGGE